MLYLFWCSQALLLSISFLSLSLLTLTQATPLPGLPGTLIINVYPSLYLQCYQTLIHYSLATLCLHLLYLHPPVPLLSPFRLYMDLLLVYNPLMHCPTSAIQIFTQLILSGCMLLVSSILLYLPSFNPLKYRTVSLVGTASNLKPNPIQTLTTPTTP